MYYFNPYAIGPLLTGVMCFALGQYVHQMDREDRTRQAFFGLNVLASLWCLSQAMVLSATDLTLASFWSHVMFSAIILMPVSMFHLASHWCKRYQRQKLIRWVINFQALCLVILSWGPDFLSGYTPYFFGLFPRAGALMYLVVFFMLSNFTISFLNINKYHFSQKKLKKRQEARFVMLSFLILLLSYSDVFVSYQQSLYPLGYIVLFGFSLSMSLFLLRKSVALLHERVRSVEEQMQFKSNEASIVSEELKGVQFQLLEAGKKSALVSLSAGILHQISQPITAIYGFIKFLKKEVKEDHEFYKPIHLVDEQTMYLKQMLGNLMELVQHKDIKKEAINVNEPVENAVNLLTDELRIGRVKWELDLAEDLPQICADNINLQQIFMNFIINAIQALGTLPKGEERQLLVSSKVDEDNKFVAVSFQDSGPGVSKGEVERIFEPFYSTKEKAVGIGLALCQDLVEEHGGQILVDSSVKQGVSFVVKLPVIGS